jgi:hypothetical protein
MKAQTMQVVPFGATPPAVYGEAFGDNIPDRVAIPQLSYRGKVWRVIVNGNENPVLDETGEPVQIISLVILNFLAKRGRAYYEGAYEEGKSAPPRCWSNDSETPDASVKEPCAEACATCQWSAKGSKITESGKAVTACAPFKRLVVVPAQDVTFQPLLLRIAQTSIWDKDNSANEAKGWYAWDQFVASLRTRGIKHTAAIVVRAKFDARVAYPKLLFNAQGWLPTDLIPAVKEQMAKPVVEKLLKGEFVEPTNEATPPDLDDDEPFEQPAPKPAAKPVEKPAAKAAPKPVAKPAPKPAVEEEDEDEEAADVVPAPAPKAAKPVTKPVTKPAIKKAPAEVEEAEVAAAGDNGLGSLLSTWDD